MRLSNRPRPRVPVFQSHQERRHARNQAFPDLSRHISHRSRLAAHRRLRRRVRRHEPDLTSFLADAVTRHTSQEAIQALVEKNIGAIVKSSVDHAMRSYGDVGKQIEKMVENALKIPGDLDVPAYGHMVLSLVHAKLDEVLNDMLRNQIGTQLDEMLSLAPPLLKLSDVVNEMRAYRKEEVRFDDERDFVVDIEEPRDPSSKYANCWVKLHCEKRPTSSGYSSPDKYFHEVRFLANWTGEGTLGALSIDKQDVKGIYRLGHMPKWKRMVFAAWCCKTPFLIDQHDFDTSIEDEDD
jgi:hypothetical protein